MSILSVILFVAVMALWFFTNEYQTVFGLYEPTYALKRSVFLAIVAFFLFAAMAFNLSPGISDSVMPLIEGTLSSTRMAAVLLAILISLSLLRLFGFNGSAVYALLGAFVAMSVVRDLASTNLLLLLLTALAAPLMALIISLLITLVLKNTIVKSNIHLIRLAHYMRYAVITAVALTAVAIGINWGGFLLNITSSLSSYNLWVVMAVVALAMIAASSFIQGEGEDESGRYYDFSIYTVLSAGFSVALTLLFFSFNETASLVGLLPIPLSVSSLVVAAIAGASLAQKSHLIEREQYFKEGVSIIAAPFLTFLCTYLTLSLMGAGEDGGLIDFAVIASSAVVLSIMLVAAYLGYQKQQKDATERLVRSQQQQIYENSRALNDMELKVILSENQALHNSVEMKRQEVMNVALSMVEQREYLESLNEIVRKLSKTNDSGERDRLVAELSSSLKQRLSYDRDVDSQYFYAQAESLHEDFNAKLAENFPDLTQQEIRLSTLLRLGFSSKYIATLLNITPKSVEISRYRLRQKLGLGRGDNLVNFIKSI